MAFSFNRSPLTPERSGLTVFGGLPSPPDELNLTTRDSDSGSDSDGEDYVPRSPQWNPRDELGLYDPVVGETLCFGRASAQFKTPHCRWGQLQLPMREIENKLHELSLKSPKDVTNADLESLLQLGVCHNHRGYRSEALRLGRIDLQWHLRVAKARHVRLHDREQKLKRQLEIRSSRQITAQHDELRRRAQAAETECLKLRRSHNNNAWNRAQEAEAECSTLKIANSSAAAELAGFCNRLLDTSPESVESSIKHLITALSILSPNDLSPQTTSADASRRLTQLRDQFTKDQQLISKLEQEVSTLRVHEKELQNKIDFHVHLTDTQKFAVKLHEDKSAKLESQLAILRIREEDVIAQLTQSRLRLEQANSTIEALKETSRKDSEALNQDLKSALVTHQILETESKECKVRMASLEEALSVGKKAAVSQQIKLEEYERAHTELKTGHAAELTQLHAKYSDIDQTVKATSMANVDLKRRCTDLQQEIDQQRGTSNRLRQDLVGESAKLDFEKRSVASLRQELEVVRAELASKSARKRSRLFSCLR